MEDFDTEYSYHDSLERDCDERYEYEDYDDTVTWDLAGPSEEEY